MFNLFKKKDSSKDKNTPTSSNATPAPDGKNLELPKEPPKVGSVKKEEDKEIAAMPKNPNPTPESSQGKKEVKELGALGIPPSPPSNQKDVAQNLTPPAPVTKKDTAETKIEKSDGIDASSVFSDDVEEKSPEMPALPGQKTPNKKDTQMKGAVTVPEEPKTKIEKVPQDDSALPEFGDVKTSPKAEKQLPAPKNSTAALKQEVDQMIKDKDASKIIGEKPKPSPKAATAPSSSREIALMTDEKATNISAKLAAFQKSTNNKINSVKNEISDLKALKKTLKEELKKAKDGIKAEKTAFDTKTKSQDKDIKTMRSNMEKILVKQNRQVDNIEKQIKWLNGKINDVRNDNESQIKEDSKEFMKLIDKQKTEQEALVLANKELMKDGAEVREKFNVLSGLVKTATSNIRGIMQEDKELFAEIAELRKLTKQVTEMNKAVNAMKKDVSGMKKDMDEFSDIVHRNDQRVSMLRDKINMYVKR
jgi:uncharacterized coiled-coil DUF342 family protein